MEPFPDGRRCVHDIQYFGDTLVPAPLSPVATTRAPATTLIVAAPTLADKMGICVTARRMNRDVRIVAFADTEGEAAWLREFGVDELIDLRHDAAELIRLRLGQPDETGSKPVGR